MHDRLRSNLQILEHIASTGHEADLSEASELFSQELVADVVRILGEDSASSDPECAPFRRAALKRALRLIDDPEQNELTVSSLSTSAGASMATLERAFTEEFGVSPKSYIRSRRLNAVRGNLLAAEPDTPVVDIANRWGFWLMGGFAAEYRRHFGELPSQTLSIHRH